MKTFVYIRVSTDKQTFDQQMNSINTYLSVRGLSADEIVSDEGVSGCVSYKNRNLNELLAEMNEGDALVVSEISRLGRSMSDLNKLVTDELKPRKIRLIIISMGLDLDCSNLKAIDEMILFAFAFGAQLERELIQERTKNALIAKKKRGEVWNKDRVFSREAIEQSRIKRKERATNNPNNRTFWEFINDYQKINGKITANTDFNPIATELNKRGKRTSTGLEFNANRARAMYHSLTNNIYNE